jgi:hypothetical protein
MLITISYSATEPSAAQTAASIIPTEHTIHFLSWANIRDKLFAVFINAGGLYSKEKYKKGLFKDWRPLLAGLRTQITRIDKETTWSDATKRQQMFQLLSNAYEIIRNDTSFGKGSSTGKVILTFLELLYGTLSKPILRNHKLESCFRINNVLYPFKDIDNFFGGRRRYYSCNFKNLWKYSYNRVTANSSWFAKVAEVEEKLFTPAYGAGATNTSGLAGTGILLTNNQVNVAQAATSQTTTLLNSELPPSTVGSSQVAQPTSAEEPPRLSTNTSSHWQTPTDGEDATNTTAIELASLPISTG